MSCLDVNGLVEGTVDKILTQYRESPNLLAIIRHDLREIAEAIVLANGVKSGVAEVVSDDYNVLNDNLQIVISDPDCPPSGGMLDKFDILTATGDQLTIIGKVLGFPRCHCVCVDLPVFGFACGEEIINIVSDGSMVLGNGDELVISSFGALGPSNFVGFCEDGVFSGCSIGGYSDICISDDELYRKFLLARRYQARQLWDIDSLQAAVNHIWGDGAAAINMGGCKVAIAPGRTLSVMEKIMLPIAMKVLPISQGIQRFISDAPGDVFGFGFGWGGMCDGAQWFCPEVYSMECEV